MNNERKGKDNKKNNNKKKSRTLFHIFYTCTREHTSDSAP